MALFHRGHHHTESIAKEKLFRGTEIPRTLVESVKTDLSSLGSLKVPTAGACWVCACLNLLICTVPFHFLGQPGVTGSTERQHGCDSPWVHFPGSFLTSSSCFHFLVCLEGLSFFLFFTQVYFDSTVCIATNSQSRLQVTARMSSTPPAEAMVRIGIIPQFLHLPVSRWLSLSLLGPHSGLCSRQRWQV